MNVKAGRLIRLTIMACVCVCNEASLLIIHGGCAHIKVIKLSVLQSAAKGVAAASMATVAVVGGARVNNL